MTKERKYDEFTYQALGKEFEPNSKSRVARQGEDITDERDAYQRARDKFRDTLVLVKKWKNKINWIN